MTSICLLSTEFFLQFTVGFIECIIFAVFDLLVSCGFLGTQYHLCPRSNCFYAFYVFVLYFIFSIMSFYLFGKYDCPTVFELNTQIYTIKWPAGCELSDSTRCAFDETIDSAELKKRCCKILVGGILGLTSVFWSIYAWHCVFRFLKKIKHDELRNNR